MCGEVLAQHKTDDELQTEGRKLLKKALKREYLVTVKQKGKKFSDDEKWLSVLRLCGIAFLIDILSPFGNLNLIVFSRHNIKRT